MQKESKEKNLEGLKIISVLSFVLTGIAFILGIFFVKFGESIAKMSITEKELIVQQGIPLPGVSNIILMGIVLLVLSVLLYYLGRDLSKLKNWARICGGVIAVLFFIISITSLFNQIWSSIILLIISGTISWYLLINKKVRKQFI